MKHLISILCIVMLTSPLVHANTAESDARDAIYTSLAKQYKPINKRNTWHHAMFKLRRELQAIAEADNSENTKYWVNRFIKNYKKIAVMVPAWTDELELENLKLLKQAAINNDKSKLRTSLKEIKRSCRACHIDYRANVAAIFRAPDFSELKLKNNKGKAQSYKKSMLQLTAQLNRIKIGLIEKNQEKSLQALQDLRAGMSHLANSCSSCHKDDESREFYLGKKPQELLDELQSGIEDDKGIKDIGRTLGSLAVRSCARCHGVHRIIYDVTTDKKNE